MSEISLETQALARDIMSDRYELHVRSGDGAKAVVVDRKDESGIMGVEQVFHTDESLRTYLSSYF